MCLCWRKSANSLSRIRKPDTYTSMSSFLVRWLSKRIPNAEARSQNLLQNARILDLAIARQQDHLRYDLRRARIVVRERQEEPPALLAVHRHDAQRAAGLPVHHRAAQMHGVAAERALDQRVDA